MIRSSRRSDAILNRIIAREKEGNEVVFKGGDRFVSRELGDKRGAQIYRVDPGYFQRRKDPRLPGFYGRIRVNDARSLAAQLFSHGRPRRGKKPSRRSIDLKCHFQHRWDICWNAKCIQDCVEKGNGFRVAFRPVPFSALFLFFFPFLLLF